jgi:hypothetical protein
VIAFTGSIPIASAVVQDFFDLLGVSSHAV